ncbi:MAG: hypothetical protein ACK4MM_04925 [Fervidobacterium sp.]
MSSLRFLYTFRSMRRPLLISFSINFEKSNFIPVFDIAHLHATKEFNFTIKEEFYRFFKIIEKIDKIHIHFSEIDYGDSGEKSHLSLETKYEPNYKLFLEVAKEIGRELNIILETPDLEVSAIKMKKYCLKIVYFK